MKNYRESHRAEHNAYVKKYRENKDRTLESRIYREKHKEKLAEYEKKRSSSRKEKRKSESCRKYQRDYIRNRRQKDINCRLKTSVGNRIRDALRGRVKKHNSTLELLGCSIESLRTFLEEKFTEGMTWDNYGTWHIDHIKPLALFDLSDPSALADAMHFTNLQPLGTQ